MAGISTQLLLYRILVAVVAILGPTVLFFGLLRFLELLKNDRLVDSLARRDVVEQPKPAPVDFLSGLPGAPDNRCANCDTQCVPTATYCRNCGERLD